MKVAEAQTTAGVFEEGEDVEVMVHEVELEDEPEAMIVAVADTAAEGREEGSITFPAIDVIETNFRKKPILSQRKNDESVDATMDVMVDVGVVAEEVEALTQISGNALMKAEEVEANNTTMNTRSHMMVVTTTTITTIILRHVVEEDSAGDSEEGDFAAAAVLAAEVVVESLVEEETDKRAEKEERIPAEIMKPQKRQRYILLPLCRPTTVVGFVGEASAGEDEVAPFLEGHM